jgi:hypothetical protein
MAEHTLTLFAHTNREHASTSTQIVAQLQRSFHFFPHCEKAVAAVPASMLCDNLRRGGA